MNAVTLDDLQERVNDKNAFGNLNDYRLICTDFLNLIEKTKPTRIVAQKQPDYIFYQYGEEYKYKVTRPLNTNLFHKSASAFNDAFDRFIDLLTIIKKHKGQTPLQKEAREILDLNEVNKVIYSMQQSIGCIGDSFEIANQSRKRVGTLFETLIKLIIQDIGITCEPRTIKIPLPNYPDLTMSYPLDLVFSSERAIITSETPSIYPTEIVGSVKVTSKDRIDRIFLDKYMLKELIGRDIPVIAIFLHDVQGNKKERKDGTSIFSVSPTFKTGHFVGYTLALNKLDGVYYVDPRPVMASTELLREQISDFQKFLVEDLWKLSSA